MDLISMLNELLTIPKDDLKVPGHNTAEINTARKAFIYSWRNTINKTIENTIDSNELKVAIDALPDKIEKPLLISLYRRYLWLQPQDKFTFQKFVKYVHPYEEQKLLLIEQRINNNDYDAALLLVEEIFLSTFSDKTLILPIKLRSFIDILHEYYELDEHNIKAMKQTKAAEMRQEYLKTVLEKRIQEETNPLELREFFTNEFAYHILMYADWGIKIAKRYFDLNPTDRKLYEIFADFLGFWALPDHELELLNYLACNDFEKAHNLLQALQTFNEQL